MPKLISNVVATFIAFQFAKAIKNKFIQWEAFKLGLIDAKGKKLKIPKTKEEKEALSPLMNLIRKIKRVILKVVPDSPIINFIIAASILKEEILLVNNNRFKTELNKILDNSEKILLEEMKQELNQLNIVETTTTSDMPSEPVKPMETYNGCHCFTVPIDLFFDIKAIDRQRYERLNKYYGDTEVAKFCRCKYNKGKTFYMKDNQHGMVRRLTAK